ncbi:plasma membrane localization protein [Arachnomyces sp. PD_36]|nr:plasma membrane localization protein [Arachnomyces sp. PD_36]
MNTVRQSCRPKHQVLILKCYPKFQKGVQQVKPNSSELSYLLYYASTRRSKLQKLGTFLERRAARDVWRGKIGNVQVTLQILTALIEKLPRDLPLYGQSVLTIIETVIRSNDISMVEETIPTFETFCDHQDVSILTADHEYASQYRDIVRSYAAFAAPSTDAPKSTLSPPEAIRWRSVGLKAIKSVVSSEALGTDGGKQLNIVVPVILQNLYLGGHDVLTSLQEKAQTSEQQERDQARRRRMSIATVQTVDTVDGHPNSAAGTTADADKAAEIEARVLALRCLERIFTTGSNRSQIRLATGLVLRFITSKSPPRDNTSNSGNWATSLMQATATWTPVQDRFAILVTAVETLVSSPTAEGKLEQQVTLASMIDSLLSSSINMIGLSVMDVLIGLVQHILLLLKLGGQDSQITPHHQQPIEHQDEQGSGEASLPEPTVEDAPASEREVSTPSPVRQELVTLLEKCIGDLATHIYYADQVSDMISAIMLRLKPSAVAHTSAAGSENLSVAERSIASPATLQDHQPNNPFFSFATARIVALKAVRNILIVANTREPMKHTGAESRNKVSIRVWEGTHWLLRDKNREVQRAYTEAILSWLQLETSKEDSKVTGEAKKLGRKLSKRGASGHTENSAKRAVSATSQREKLSSAPRSSFLPLLHLAIYENAIEFSANEPDILLLHLLLTSLADKIGVNAVRHSLPVIMRLQEDIASSDAITSPVARRNVSSLVHGYLWALSQRFRFQTSKIGNNIENEISKRKKLGCWLDNIRLPALPLGDIRSIEAHDDPEIHFDRRAIAPFTAINTLVDHIELAYNEAVASSPISSAPSSPGRVSSLPIFGQGQHSFSSSPKPAADEQLPANAKEEMLSTWSKEICLAVVERENAKTSSLTGSKTGTSGPRNYLTINGNGNENGSPTAGSPTAPYRRNQLHDRPPSTAYGLVGGTGNHQKIQRGDDSHTPLTSSSRESTVRVNDLRRLLSATNDNSVRHSSPLRGRMDFARRGSRSSGTSSRESMISGAFSASDIDTTANPTSSRPQSLRDGNGRVTQGRDSSATPKATATRVNSGDLENSNGSMTKVISNDIPPVPPLPAALSIPGGFPDSAAGSPTPSPSYSPVRSDFRPSTAPSQPRARPTVKPKQDTTSAPRQSRSLSRPKSRKERNVSVGKQASSGSPIGHANEDNAESSGSPSRGTDVDKLLDGIFTRGAEGLNGGVDGATSGLSTNLSGSVRYNALGDVPSDGRRRRQSAGGIGRPPY